MPCSDMQREEVFVWFYKLVQASNLKQELHANFVFVSVYMCTTLWQKFHKPDFGLPPATPPAMTSRAHRTSETEINNHLPCGADLLYSFKPVHVRVSYMDRLSRTGTELFDVDGHIMPRRTRLPPSRCVGDSRI